MSETLQLTLTLRVKHKQAAASLTNMADGTSQSANEVLDSSCDRESVTADRPDPVQRSCEHTHTHTHAHTDAAITNFHYTEKT